MRAVFVMQEPVMFTIRPDNDAEHRREIANRLRAANRARCAWLRANPSAAETRNFLAFDGGRLIGGAVGFVRFGWYFLDLLYVDAACRNRGLGRQLLTAAEHFARDRQLVGVRLDTADFQARGFYEKMGYTLFGELADCPPGHSLYFLHKTFTRPKETP